jgi:hypothetical protein
MLTGACALVAALAVAGPAYAGVINVQVPFESDNVNPCTGEPFHYSQTWHIVAHTAVDADGNEFPTSTHINSQQTDGIGLLTGDKYQVNQIGNTTDHPLSDGAHAFTAVAQFHVIDQGKGDDFFLNETFHTTVNANGDLTVFHESGNVRCGNDNSHVGV